MPRRPAGRFDDFGNALAAVLRNDVAKQAVLERLKNNAMAAMGNMPKLMSGAGQ
jgi:hypothetical protein